MFNSESYITYSVAKRHYVENVDKALNRKAIEVFNGILAFLNFKSAEIRVYNLLLTTSLTIKKMEQRLNTSERSMRKYIKRLEEEGLITKRVEQGTRLKYVYRSVPIQEAWNKVENKIEKMMGNITRVLRS